MKSALAKIFLRKTSEWWFWIIVALVVKGVILLFQLGHADHGGYNGLIGNVGGDTKLYLEPIEHLINSGTYDPDYRMPGYGVLYFFLRLVFNQVTALNALVVMQYLAAALSVYALALTAGKIFKRPAIFYITYYLFLISTYSNLEDGSVLTESFATSFLIFAVFFVAKWNEDFKSRNLFISGLLLTEVIFLRPVFAPLLLFFALFILINAIKNARPATVKYVLIFLIPFMLIDGTWVVRNYNLHGRILPLSTVLYLKGDNLLFWAALDFMQTWGGNYISWDPASEMRYFNIKEKLSSEHKKIMQDKYKPLPNDIYTSRFNADSLEVLKNMIADIQADTNPVTAKLHTNQAISLFETYGQSIKKEKPFVYYVKAPLRMCRIFLFHSGTYNLFPKAASQLSKPELVVKIGYSLFYILGLLLGFIGLLLLAGKSLAFGPEVLITGIVVFVIVIHAFVMRVAEARYFMPAWPFLLICVAYTIYWSWSKLPFGNNRVAG